MNFRKYITQLSIYAVIVLVLGLAVFLILPAQYITDVYFLIVPFFYLVSLLTRLFLQTQADKKGTSLSKHYMGLNTSRFLLYFGVLLTYAFLRSDDAVPFIVTFFVFYFCFTVFEVWHIHKSLHSNT